MNDDKDDGIENVKFYLTDLFSLFTEGRSGADIVQLVNTMKINAVRRGNQFID